MGCGYHVGALSGVMANHRSCLTRSARLVFARAATLGVLADSLDFSLWFEL